jgi:hypothetical protein
MEIVFDHRVHVEIKDRICRKSYNVLWKYMIYIYVWGTALAQWLRRCATNRKVAGSIPNGFIGIFHLHNPTDRTMALGSTQPLIEVSTRRISCG